MGTARFIILLALTAAFICLSIIVKNNTPLQIDLDLGSFLQGDGALAGFMSGVSALGGGWVPPLLTLAFFAALYFAKKRAEAFFLLINIFTFTIINAVLKWLIDRPRPGHSFEEGGTSFPSGHTGFTMVLMGWLFIIAPDITKNAKLALLIRLCSLIFIALMGISRIYLNAHWASDVLGGVLLGTLVLGWVYPIYKKYKKKVELNAGAS